MTQRRRGHGQYGSEGKKPRNSVLFHGRPLQRWGLRTSLLDPVSFLSLLQPLEGQKLTVLTAGKTIAWTAFRRSNRFVQGGTFDDNERIKNGRRYRVCGDNPNKINSMPNIVQESVHCCWFCSETQMPRNSNVREEELLRASAAVLLF